MKKIKAFTLIELLISIAILAVIMLALYGAFSAGSIGLRQIEENARISETGYMVLSRIDRDLRNSFAYTLDDVRFAGKKDTLGFFSLTPDFSFVSYSLDGNKFLRLLRSNKQALKIDAAIKARILAKNVKEIEFSYLTFDPVTKKLKEADTWSANNLLPMAIRVKLTLEKREKEPFVRIIYLPTGN